MPSPESSAPQVNDRPYGERQTEQNFIAQTEPQSDPLPLTPATSDIDDTPDDGPDDLMSSGAPLDMSMLSLLAEPHPPLPDAEAQYLLSFLPVVKQIAALPDASPGMRAIAEQLSSRFEGED